MLGITSERFPEGGALALAIIGASGSFATAISGPVMGRISDSIGVTAQNPERAGEVLAWWAMLPVTLVVIFGAIYLRDKAAGGYRVEQISAVQPKLKHEARRTMARWSGADCSRALLQ